MKVKNTVGLGFLAAALLLPGANARAQEDWPQFRHTNYIALVLQKDKKISSRFQCIEHGRYADSLVYRLIDPNSEGRALGDCPLGEARATSYTPKQSGLHLYELNSGWNLATITVQGAPWAIVATERTKLNTIKAIWRLYFYVPKGVRRFNIFLGSSTTGEGLRIKIFSPEGLVVHEEEGDYDRTRRIRVKVPEGADGKAWSLSILKPKAPGLNLDDAQLYLGAELAPYLAKRPEWALLFGRRRHP